MNADHPTLGLLEPPAPYVSDFDLADLCYSPKCLACGGIDVARDSLRVRRCGDCGGVVGVEPRGRFKVIVE